MYHTVASIEDISVEFQPYGSLPLWFEEDSKAEATVFFEDDKGREIFF